MFLMGVLVSAGTRTNTGSTTSMGYSGCFTDPSYAQGASISGEGSSCGGASWSLAPYGHGGLSSEHLLEMLSIHTDRDQASFPL